MAVELGTIRPQDWTQYDYRFEHNMAAGSVTS
jgi:hypothetical protein